MTGPVEKFDDRFSSTCEMNYLTTDLLYRPVFVCMSQALVWQPDSLWHPVKLLKKLILHDRILMHADDR